MGPLLSGGVPCASHIASQAEGALALREARSTDAPASLQSRKLQPTAWPSGYGLTWPTRAHKSPRHPPSEAA